MKTNGQLTILCNFLFTISSWVKGTSSQKVSIRVPRLAGPGRTRPSAIIVAIFSTSFSVQFGLSEGLAVYQESYGLSLPSYHLIEFSPTVFQMYEGFDIFLLENFLDSWVIFF